MKCVKCGSRAKVVNSRSAFSETMRLRKCVKCEYMFYTFEFRVDWEAGYDAMRSIERRLTAGY